MRIPFKDQHWYRVDGNSCFPCYELEKSSSPGTKAPTLADAKKLRLLPSVTNVISILDKAAVNNWRVGQAIIASLTLPRRPGETPDDFAVRVVTDMESVSNAAKEFGTEIHAQAINWLQTGEKGTLWPYLEGLPTAIAGYSYTSLEEIVHSIGLGVAGRLDYAGKNLEDRPAIIDIKTQNVRNGNPVFYPEWGLQLSAYAACKFGFPIFDCDLVSVVIPSKEPGPVAVKVWEGGRNLYEMFCRCVDLWCWQKGYDPRGQNNYHG